MSNPWFKFYSAEYLLDAKVAALSLEAQGLLVRVWSLCHTQGKLPDNLKVISKLVGTSPQTISKLWNNIVPFLSQDENGFWYSKRLLSEQQKCREKSSKLAKNGRLGGLAKANNLLQQNPENLLEQNSSLKEEEEDKEEDKEITTTPLPPQAGEPEKPPQAPSLKKPAKRRKKGEVIQAFPDSVRQVVGTTLKIWHTRDPDGRKITADVDLFGQRISEILENHSEITPEILIEAGKTYLATDRMRYKAPQFFFGPGPPGESPPWLGYVRGIISTQAKLGGSA